MQPEQKFKAGAVEVSIWKNESEKGDYHSISFQRSYKDKEGNWQTTNSLKVNDLPKALIALGKAYEYVALKTS